MKRLLIATTALTALAATAAVAADLPAARMPAKAPAVMPVYNWTGFYLGVNLGGAWTDTAFTDASGVIGGGQIGYNWQAVGSPLVLGIEADFQGSTQSETVTIGPASANAKLPWFGTVRGRLGFAFDRVMVYGTGGFAFQQLEVSVTVPPVTLSASDTGTGYTLGGGIEWAFWDRWSAKGEYLYINTNGLTVLGVSSGRVENNVVRAGLNYRF